MEYKKINTLSDSMKHTMQMRNFEVWVEDYGIEDVIMYNYYIDRFKKMQCKYNKEKKITFKIHSYGGSVHGVLSLISTVETLKKQGWIVEMIGMGMVMSAGFDFLMSGSKGHRYCQRYTELMTHDSRNFQYGISTHEDKKRDYKSSEKSMEVFMGLLEKNTKITREQFMKYVDRKEDWFMSSSEALELTIVSITSLVSAP